MCIRLFPVALPPAFPAEIFSVSVIITTRAQASCFSFNWVSLPFSEGELTLFLSRNTEFGDVLYTESMQQLAEATVQHFMLTTSVEGGLFWQRQTAIVINYSATLLNVEVRDV